MNKLLKVAQSLARGLPGFYLLEEACRSLGSKDRLAKCPTKGVSLLKESTRRGSPTYWLYLCIIIIINRLLGENKPVNFIYILEKKKSPKYWTYSNKKYAWGFGMH